VGIGVGQNAADNLVVGNTVRNNGRDGIYLFSEAIRNTIRDNTVHDNVRFGIYAKSAGNTVEGNHVSGNPSGDVRE
jgi:parallel beta-helix repeat protein